MKTFLKNLILQETGKISWSKFTIWLAGVASLIAELNAQLTAAGIAIPVQFLPYIKAVSVTSAIIAGIRIRNATATPTLTTQAPAAPTTDATTEIK